MATFPRKKTALRLVVSDRIATAAREPAEHSRSNGEGFQLELFPTNAHRAIVTFVKPKEANFKEIMDTIAIHSAKAILDIREAPFLDFGEISRGDFLNYLERMRAAYVNIHALKRQARLESVAELFSHTDSSTHAWGTIVSMLSDLLSQGSFIVFSDKDPKSDDLVTALEKALLATQADFSVYFLED